MLDGMTNIKASEVLKELKDYTEDLPHYSPDEVEEALDKAIKALTQQPFINKPCVSEGVCREDKIQVLDKIKAEIIEEFDNCNICEWFEDYDYDENNISEYIFMGHISDIIDIIDKYRK